MLMRFFWNFDVFMMFWWVKNVIVMLGGINEKIGIGVKLFYFCWIYMIYRWIYFVLDKKCIIICLKVCLNVCVCIFVFVMCFFGLWGDLCYS